MAKKDKKTQVQEVYPEFVDAVMGLSVEDLNKQILLYAKERENVREAKEKDDGLRDLTEAKKLAEGPYRDTNKAINLKTSFLFELIKEKGGS